jgi:hypothetical protein
MTSVGRFADGARPQECAAPHRAPARSALIINACPFPPPSLYREPRGLPQAADVC